MIFPVEAAQGRAGLTKEKYPNIAGYIERIQARDGYKRSVQKIEKEFGEYKVAQTT